MTLLDRLAAFLAIAGLAIGPLIAQAPSVPGPMRPSAPLASAAPPASPAPAPALTKADVDAWLDGYLPYALQTGDIAGATIAVVKDGQVVTERGYGFADVKTRRPIDPRTTVFRPGSISKLFTWTAVMQLVQAHKLDLDADIGTYLDFRIPPAFGKPITLRDLMTHRPGFEEGVKHLISEDTRHVPSLGASLKRWIPPRVYAPGTTPAYSNYGASLAGYIVERVSGEPFEQYVRHHIFAPLGMAHSSFAQPLPPSLAKSLSGGYDRASGAPHPFEVIPPSPAGALSSTADDMTRFMIAHLAGGGPILSPETAREMHTPDLRAIPGVPGMALGFYHEDRNGLNIIAHAGDTNWFHSDLHLYMGKNVGLFLSFNSAGKDASAHILRDRLFVDFTNRYFPDRAAPLPTVSTAHRHGLAMAGTYISSRSSYSNWLKLLSLLGEAKVSLNPDDTITVSALTDAAGVPKRWREIGPWLWQDVAGEDRLGASIKDGRVAAFAPAAYAPIILFIPPPADLQGSWMVPAIVIALIVMLLTALTWPVRAVLRWRYGYRAEQPARSLWLARLTQATAWLMLVVAAGWMTMVMLLEGDVANTDGRLDGWMRLIQFASLLAIAGTVASVVNVWTVARRPNRSVGAVAWAAIVALAAIFLVWAMLTLRTVTFALDY